MRILDCETYRWFDHPEIAHLPRSEQIPLLGFGCGVLWDTEQGYRLYWPGDLLDLWHEIVNAEVVAGWNIRRFDLVLLLSEVRERLGIQPDPGWPRATLDPFEDIVSLTGRYYKLEAIAAANLGRSKTADGKTAALWLSEWQATGNWEAAEKAAAYCRDDVALERAVIERLRGPGLYLPARLERGEKAPLLATWGRGGMEIREVEELEPAAVLAGKWSSLA